MTVLCLFGFRAGGIGADTLTVIRKGFRIFCGFVVAQRVGAMVAWTFLLQ